MKLCETVSQLSYVAITHRYELFWFKNVFCLTIVRFRWLALPGQGTASSELTRLLGLEPHKAVILSVVREDRVEEIMNCLEDKFRTIRGGKGVAFAVPFSSVIGVNLYQFLSDNRMGREASL